MAITIDLDGRIIYGEEKRVKQHEGLAKYLTLPDSMQEKTQINSPDINPGDNLSNNNAVAVVPPGCVQKIDEYGTVSIYDSDGNLVSISVSPLKID